MATLDVIIILLLCIKGFAGEEYLLGLVDDVKEIYITTTVGEGTGSAVITFPIGNGSVPIGNETQSFPDGHKIETCEMGSFSKCDIIIKKDHFSDFRFANKSIIINTSSRDVSVAVYYRYAVFSPLPSRLLGTRYILPSCQKLYKRLLIATTSKGVDVTITFRLKPQNFKYKDKTYNDGDTLKLTLEPFTTFALDYKNFDLTGTTIEASYDFAVFDMSWRYGQVYSYDQIPPVSEYGTEYIIAVIHQNHTLQVVSEDLDNTLTFSDGRSIKTRFYEETVIRNSSIYFQSSKPVMASLCIRSSNYYDRFSVVPPINSFGQREVSLYAAQSHADALVMIIRKSNVSITVNQFAESLRPMWKSTASTQYQIGIFMTTNEYATSITGSGDFVVMIWSNYDLRFGENRFIHGELTPQDEEAELTDGTTDNLALIVGLLCGVVILILLVVIVFMGLYLKRLRNQKITDEAAPTLPSVPPPDVPPPHGVTNDSYAEGVNHRGYEGLQQRTSEEQVYQQIEHASL